MSTLTYDIAADRPGRNAKPTAPARKRKGLFARFMEARQRQAMQELAPPRPAAAARAGRGRAEDQRAQRGFAAVRALSACGVRSLECVLTPRRSVASASVRFCY